MQAKFVGRWVPSGNSMTTGYPGSSFSFRVSGTNYVNVSISGATRIAYKVDDGPYVVTNNVQITGLTLSAHKIKIVLTTSIQTWAGNNYAQVTGIEVASGGSIVMEPATKRKCLVFGDSITEGYNASGQNTSASECTWWNKLSDMLDMDITPVGIGGIGYVTSANTYPSVKSVPSYIENITSSSVVSNTDYDLVIIELGTNDWKSKTEVDSDFVTDVTSVVNRIKSKYPNADIHALIPFTLNGQPSLNQAYGNTNVSIISTSWYSDITFADDLHPNEIGNTVVAINVYSYLLNRYGEEYFKEVTMNIIDNDKIIQLNNGLYAKRITQSDLPDIFLGGFFTSDSDTQVQLYTSDNGINFNKLTALNINSRDVSIRYYHQCFYLVKSMDGTATFTLYKSRDLRTWESKDFTVINRGGKAVWAPDLFIDDDGSAYVYFALQWGTERVGESTRDYTALDMYVSRCSNIENAEFETAVSMNLPTFNDDVTVVRGNNIDGHVFKNEGVYYCIVKCDHQLSLQTDGGYLGLNMHLLKSSNAMTNWTEITTFPLKWIKGVEGASVVIKNDMVYMYADAHGEHTLPHLNHDKYGGTWCWRARLSDLETGAYNIEPITTNQDNRHGCVIDISANYAKRILTTFNPTFIKTGTQKSFYTSIPLRNANGGSAQNSCNITKFVPVQNVTYVATAGFYTIDGIKNVNQATDFYMRMAAGNDVRIHIKNDTGDNRDLWIGNGRNINGQILHFRLKGTEIMYVGNVETLCQSMCYGKVGPAALLCNFDVSAFRTVLLKVNVCSGSSQADLALYANEFLIRVYNSPSGGIGAKIKRLSGNGNIGVKLINTGAGVYQLWGKSSTENLCLSIEEIMTGNIQPNPFKVISFPYVTASDYPAGTEVPIES